MSRWHVLAVRCRDCPSWIALELDLPFSEPQHVSWSYYTSVPSEEKKPEILFWRTVFLVFQGSSNVSCWLLFPCQYSLQGTPLWRCFHWSLFPPGTHNVSSSPGAFGLTGPTEHRSFSQGLYLLGTQPIRSTDINLSLPLYATSLWPPLQHHLPDTCLAEGLTLECFL